MKKKTKSKSSWTPRKKILIGLTLVLLLPVIYFADKTSFSKSYYGTRHVNVRLKKNLPYYSVTCNLVFSFQCYTSQTLENATVLRGPDTGPAQPYSNEAYSLDVPDPTTEFNWKVVSSPKHYLNFQGNGAGGSYELFGKTFETTAENTTVNRELVENFYQARLGNRQHWFDATNTKLDLDGLLLGQETVTAGGGPCKGLEKMWIGYKEAQMKVVIMRVGNCMAGVEQPIKHTVFISEPFLIQDLFDYAKTTQ